MTQEENIDRLVSQLAEQGFHKLNMYEYLSECVGMNMDSISHNQRSRIGDDEMSYQVAIKKNEVSGLYYPEGYEATLLKTHPVPHATFGKIDTGKLEDQMKNTLWYKTLQQIAYDPKTAGIYEDIHELLTSNDARAHDIANRLMLRYWQHTPIEQNLNIFGRIADYQKTAYFPLNDGLSDMHAREAYNLLSGRGVMKFYQKENEPDVFHSHWKVIDNGELKTLPAYDFGTSLKQLAVHEALEDATGPQLIYDLIRGERCAITLIKDKEPEKAYMEADPKTQSFRLLSINLTELNPEYYRLNDVQLYLLKKQMPAMISYPKKKGRNKGKSL